MIEPTSRQPRTVPPPVTTPNTSVRVRVPATSANLGPGFDALGLALDVYDDLTAHFSEGKGSITVAGEGRGVVPDDESNLVYRCVQRGLAACGHRLTPVVLECHNVIPHGRGMGSSSAAIVGGLAVGRALARTAGAPKVDAFDDQALFSLAAEIEGHPDNVAPAALGGFTLAYRGSHGYAAVKLPVAESLEALVIVPSTQLETERARGLLPAVVAHGDAAFNAGRTALMLPAVAGDLSLMWEATADRLHQAQRASAMPESARLIEELRRHEWAAVVSGAGPTVLVLPVRTHEGLPEVGQLAARLGEHWQVLRVWPGGKGVHEC